MGRRPGELRPAARGRQVAHAALLIQRFRGIAGSATIREDPPLYDSERRSNQPARAAGARRIPGRTEKWREADDEPNLRHEAAIVAEMIPAVTNTITAGIQRFILSVSS